MKRFLECLSFALIALCVIITFACGLLLPPVPVRCHTDLQCEQRLEATYNMYEHKGE